MTTPAMTRDGQALLDAILDEPEDDLHRLVYADFLEEQGDDLRARNVRHQIERAKDGVEWEARPSTDAGRLALLSLLLGAPLAGLVDSEASMALAPEARPVAVLSRGFVREVHLGHDLFVAHAEAIFCRHPVGRVVLTDCEPAENGAEHFALYDRLDSAPSRRRPWWLHSPLYGLLSMSETPHHKWRVYPSRQAALADLERACLLFGLALRKKAREERSCR